MAMCFCNRVLRLLGEPINDRLLCGADSLPAPPVSATFSIYYDIADRDKETPEQNAK
jgi:hypothetical protein